MTDAESRSEAVGALFTATAEMHPGYMWNQEGTRIRCHGCGDIMDADEADVQSVYAGHQGRAYRPFAEELGSLRAMTSMIADAVDNAGADKLPHAFLTDLAWAFSHVVEALPGPHSAAATAALNVVNRHLDSFEAEPGGRPAESGPEAEPVAVPAVDPEPLPEPAPVVEAAQVSEPVPGPEQDKPAAPAKTGAVAALDWMGELPQDSGTEAPVKKPRKVKVWTPPETVSVFNEDNRAEMASVAAGDRVRARFITANEGDFTIEATVINGPAGKTLIAGSLVVSAGGEPGRHLHTVTILEPAGVPAFTPSTEPEHFGLSA